MPWIRIISFVHSWQFYFIFDMKIKTYQMKKIFTLLFIICACVARAQNCLPNASSLVFDGVSTYVDLSTNNNLDITDSISIEAWINASAWGTTYAKGSIVCNHGWSSGEAGYALRAGGSGQLSFNISCDSLGTNISWKDVISNPNVLQLNTWYHVVGTFDGYDLKIYINGALAQTNSLGFQASIVPSPNYSLKIGRLADVNQPESRFWSGKIDEVRIWHRVLTLGEINANMNHHIDNTTAADLVGYYRLNESSGTSAGDLGTGNNTGTVISGTWTTDVPFNDVPQVPIITWLSPNLYSSSVIGNQWYLNGNLLSGETGSSIVPAQNGSYTVAVTAGSGCSVTSAPFVLTSVGIEKISAVGFRIDQNPSFGFLRIEMDNNLKSVTELKIIDVNGRSVLAYEKGSINNEIDIHSLSAGVYIVCIQMNDKLYKQKLVLN